MPLVPHILYVPTVCVWLRIFLLFISPSIPCVPGIHGARNRKPDRKCGFIIFEFVSSVTVYVKHFVIV